MVKAATQAMQVTSLSVVCADGNVYPFRVQYDSMPTVWVWTIAPLEEANLTTYATAILDNPATTHRPHSIAMDMSIRVSGIYIRNDVMYYQLALTNGSPIDYEIDALQFFIRDKKKTRRTATQETAVSILCTIGNIRQVTATSSNTIVIALPKMTLAEGKYLVVQLLEKNGGRHLLLKIKNKHLLKAIPLPSIH